MELLETLKLVFYHSLPLIWKPIKSHEKARQMKKVFCFNNCACRVFRTNLVLVWFQCCPSYLSRKKGISGTFLSLGLRPRLQKIFPRFPFFYFSNLDNTSIRRGQICPQTWQHNYRNKILSFFHFNLNDTTHKIWANFESVKSIKPNFQELVS